MIEFVEFAFSGFLVWIGFVSIVSIPLRFLIAIYTMTMRCLMVRKHGWPPSHLDADGDWKLEKKQE